MLPASLFNVAFFLCFLVNFFLFLLPITLQFLPVTLPLPPGSSSASKQTSVSEFRKRKEVGWGEGHAVLVEEWKWQKVEYQILQEMNIP